MKPLEFDMNTANIDAFRVPHIAKHGFVHFVTGETIYCNGAPDPSDRYRYNSLDVQLVATGDDDCPALYLTPDADAYAALPKAWLTQGGQQYLAIDWERKVAVRMASRNHSITCTGRSFQGVLATDMRGTLDERTERIPAYLAHRCVVYWAGPRRRPVGDPITVSEPFVPDADQRAHLKAIKDQTAAWAALTGLDDANLYVSKVNVAGVPTTVPAAPFQLTDYLKHDFTNTPVGMRLALLRHGGWAPARVETKHQYLYVR